jgi:hypothetical protein
MRWVAYIPAKPPGRAKRVIIVRNPKSVRFIPDECAVLFFGYYSEGEDGPSTPSEYAPTVEDAMAAIQEYSDEPLHWQEIPDQLPGCEDSWIGPVRIYRGESGAKVYHRWQRFVAGEWREFEGPRGGYGLQIDPEDVRRQPP